MNNIYVYINLNKKTLKYYGKTIMVLKMYIWYYYFKITINKK